MKGSFIVTDSFGPAPWQLHGRGKVSCKSVRVITREKQHSCKGCGLDWTPSFDGKFTSALGCCLPVSVRWTFLSYWLISLSLESCIALELRVMGPAVSMSL